MVTRVTRYLPEHNGIPQDIPQRNDMPYELTCHEVGGGGDASYVRVTVDRPAALVADWFDGGRAEVMAAGRPLVVERDTDGVGVRVVEPMSGLPLAGFDPARPSALRPGGRRRGRGSGSRPGGVLLADGTALRWICPTRSVYEYGFVSGSANVVRFAHDGTAIICVRGGLAQSGSPTGSTAVALDVLVLVVLGWFLLLDAGRVLGDAGEVAGGPSYTDLPVGPAVSGDVQADSSPLPTRSRTRRRGDSAARPAPDTFAS